MKSFWSKYKVSIIITSYTLLVVLVMYFLAFPLIKNIRKQANQMQKQLVDQKIKHSQISQFPQMKKELADYQNKSSSLNVLFDSSNEVKFIENLETIADKTGNSIKLKIGDSVKIIKKTKKKSKIEEGIEESITYKKYFPIQISLSGDYNGLVNFIYQIENDKLYLNVVSIDSKKQKVAKDQAQSNNATNVNGVFSSSVVTDSEKLTKDEPKEVLNSNIKVIVYLKE